MIRQLIKSAPKQSAEQTKNLNKENKIRVRLTENYTSLVFWADSNSKGKVVCDFDNNYIYFTFSDLDDMLLFESMYSKIIAK